MAKSKWDYRECNQCGKHVINHYTVGCNPIYGVWCKVCIKEQAEKDNESIPFYDNINNKFCSVCKSFINGHYYMYAMKIGGYYHPFCLNCKGYWKTDKKLMAMVSIKKIKDSDGK